MRFAKQSKGKKNIAVLLVVAMLLTIMPVAAFAVDEEDWGVTITPANVEVTTGSTVTFVATATTSSAVTVEWTGVDKTEDGNPSKATRTFNEVGSYDVTATFTTEDGESRSASVTVEVIKPDENPVAMIGVKSYETLDAAIEAANDGDTIEVLKDCETVGIKPNVDSLVIKGATGNEKITFKQTGIAILENGDQARTLTFKDCTLDLTQAKDNPEQGGEVVLINYYCTLNLDNVDMLMKGSTTYKGHGIFLHGGGVLNVINDSNVKIENFAYGENGGKENQNGVSGIYCEPDEVSENFPTKIIFENSHLFITGCYWSGMTVNRVNTTFDGSNVVIKENGMEGPKSRGGYSSYWGSLKIVNGAEVTISNNEGGFGDGIWIKDLSIDSTSTLNACNNKGTGMTIGGEARIESSAVVNIKDNDGSGLRIYPAGTTWAGDCTIEKGANVTITGNKNSGIYNQNKLNMQSGIVMYNSADYGGGIYNVKDASEAILSSDVQIYNNHAKVAGDDIFNDSKITFGVTGDDWKLDGAPDCNGEIHAIDGWYEDGWAKDENGDKYRWEAHEDADKNHIVEFKDFDDVTGLATITSQKALKAAHGLLSASQLTCNYYVKDKNGNVKLEGAVEYDSEIGKVGTTVTKNQSEYTTYNGKTYVYDETNPSNKNSVVLEKSLEKLNNVPYPLTLNYIREEKDDTPTGGGGTITPNPDPEPPTTDPEKPPVEIPDTDVPLVEPDDPTTEIDEPDVPLIDVPGTPVEEIDEPEVPLGDAPKTGDAAPIVGLIGLLIVAVAGLVVVRRKFN